MLAIVLVGFVEVLTQSVGLAALSAAVGLVLLIAGGDALVRGATRLAQLMRFSPAVIGLTIVAAGTSAPELVVSVRSAVAGTPDLALGNVVGSNIFNIGAILGLAAIIAPLRIVGNSVRLEWPVMFLAACQLHLLARDGEVDRLEGACLLVGLVAFLAYLIRIARRDTSEAEREEFSQALPEPRDAGVLGEVVRALAWVLVGVLGLVVGAYLLVEGAVAIARGLDVSERVIAVTLVAAGTSLPELATSVIAAVRGHDDIAVANVLGSNIFNVLGILGCTALITPVAANQAIIDVDNLWMLGLSALLFPLMRSGMQVNRVEGLLLLGVYGAYVFGLLRSLSG